MGIGDWGLGIGDWGFGPIPKPPSPNPQPQSPIPLIKLYTSFQLLVLKGEGGNRALGSAAC